MLISLVRAGASTCAQGYETGRLIAVTPFVAKILEGAPSGNSRVFKPPNPWIMGLFSALHEVRCVAVVVKVLIVVYGRARVSMGFT